MYYDETLFVQSTWARDDVPIAYTMHIRGRPVALMLISYLGALKGWIYIPLVRLFEPTAALVRLPMLGAGAGALAFFYLFARRAFGWQAALGATALAATDPIYLFTTRQDWGPVAIQRLCLAAGCWGALRWRQERRSRDLFWGGFAFGIGVFDKATMLWMLAGLGAAAVLVYGRWVRTALRTRAGALGLAGLLIGAAPFLYYCKKWPGETFRQEREDPGKYAEKLRGVQYTLEGTILIGWFTREPDTPEPLPETLLLPACVLCLLLLPALPFRPWGRGMLFLAISLAAAFAPMLLIRNAGAAHHLALLLPFPQLFATAGLAGTQARLAAWAERPVWRRAAGAGLAAMLILLAGANLRVVADHYRRILKYGGANGWSEAIYSLHRTLERSRAERIFLLDWGIMNQLRWLSRDRLPLAEAPQPQGPGDDAPYLSEWLDRPGALWVKLAAGEAPAFPQIAAAWRSAVAARERRAELVETVRDLRGRPVYEVWIVR